MKLELDYIEARNFGAIGNEPIRIDFGNLNDLFIHGTNGSGKSTQLEVLFYTLFGCSYRNKTNNADLINSKNGKGLLTKEVSKKVLGIMR